jgi:hypothetical protein
MRRPTDCLRDSEGVDALIRVLSRFQGMGSPTCLRIALQRRVPPN